MFLMFFIIITYQTEKINNMIKFFSESISILVQGNSIYFLKEFYLLERSHRKTNMKFVSQ